MNLNMNILLHRLVAYRDGKIVKLKPALRYMCIELKILTASRIQAV